MRPTFAHLARLDRRLFGLYVEAATTAAGPDFCAMRAWSGRDGLKSRLARLVGYERTDDGHPDLTTSEAYDAAYGAILAALPNCRGECWCGASKAAAV